MRTFKCWGCGVKVKTKSTEWPHCPTPRCGILMDLIKEDTKMPHCPVCHRNDKVRRHPITNMARDGWWQCQRGSRAEWHRRPTT